MSLEQEFIFGQEAEKVIQNKAYQFALTAIRGELFSKLESVKVLASNQDEVNGLVMSLQSINAFQEELESMMTNGEFARKELERNNTKKG